MDREVSSELESKGRVSLLGRGWEASHPEAVVPTYAKALWQEVEWKEGQCCWTAESKTASKGGSPLSPQSS